MPAAFVWVVFQAELSPMTSDVLMCQVIGRQPEHVKVHLIKKVGDHAVQLLRLGREGVWGHLDRGVQLLRLEREGVQGHFDRGVQADSTDLLREKALAQPGPNARMGSPGSDCTVIWQ